MMLVPEAWQNDPLMPQEKKDFYMMASCLVSLACVCVCVCAGLRAQMWAWQFGTQGTLPSNLPGRTPWHTGPLE